MKVGVTGASGFIGRKLTKKLLDSGYEVKKFVRREPQAEDEIYWSPSKKEIDKDKFKELDAVIHLAGLDKDRSDKTIFHKIQTLDNKVIEKSLRYIN